MINMNYIVSMLLMVMGLYCILQKENLLKIVMGLGILDNGLNLLLISTGYRRNGLAPILSGPDKKLMMVDPIPQALTLTSIVIGVCVTALALAIIVKVNEHYHSISAHEIRRLQG